MSCGGEGRAADDPLPNFVVEVVLLAAEAPTVTVFFEEISSGGPLFRLHL